MLHKIGEGEERGGRRIKEETTFDSFSHSNISLLSDVLMIKIYLLQSLLQERIQQNEAFKSTKIQP